MSNWTNIGCWRYRAALEDRAGGNELRPEANAKLDAHLDACAKCRQSLDDALLATALLRDSDLRPADDSFDFASDYSAPYPDYSGSSSTRFSAGVMACIREEISRRAAPDVIWRPLELLASRFAMAAAAVLLVLSIYMVEFAPPLRPALAAIRAEATQVEAEQVEPGTTEAGAIMPEPPAQPATPDEVLMSLSREGQ